jgi:hypothetical protein
MKSSVLAIVALLGLASAQWDNNVPVPGRRPEFVKGTAKQGIDFEIIYDLMCSDSAALNPEFQKFLNMTWNVTNTLVSDAVQVRYSFLPLPYHHETWIPHRLVPFFLDNCAFGPNPCVFEAYMNYCFAN